jgi:hypothetical protein
VDRGFPDFDEGMASLEVRDVSVMDAHDLLNHLTNGHGFPSRGVPPIASMPAKILVSAIYLHFFLEPACRAAPYREVLEVLKSKS